MAAGAMHAGGGPVAEGVAGAGDVLAALAVGAALRAREGVGWGGGGGACRVGGWREGERRSVWRGRDREGPPQPPPQPLLPPTSPLPAPLSHVLEVHTQSPLGQVGGGGGGGGGDGDGCTQLVLSSLSQQLSPSQGR